MEIFINELSLEGQYYDQDEFVLGVRTFISIFSEVKKKVKDAKYYEDEFFLYSNAIQNEIFKSSLEKVADKSLRRAFYGLINNKLNAKSWREERMHLLDDAYFYFESEDLIDVSDKTLAEIAERNLQFPDKRRLSVNFRSSRYENLEIIEIYKNSEESETLQVDCCDCLEILANWIGEIERPATDFLRNKERFEPTSKISPVVKTKIYKEINTGYYWCFDNFHKDEFEVYDNQGNHIGTANLEGEIDFIKAKADRNISNIL